MKTSPAEGIIEATERIDQALSRYTLGWKNAEAIAEITKEARSIEALLPIQPEKLSSLLVWTDILFSPKKWRAYGTPERVAAFVRQDCSSIRAIASGMKLKKGSDVATEFPAR